MPDTTPRANAGETTERRRPGPKPGTEAAKRGGLAAKAKYGHDFYRHIGKLGGTANRDKHGIEHYSSIGRMGGERTRAKHGRDHYARIGKIGGTMKGKHAEKA
jgi:uncharacterized protein